MRANQGPKVMYKLKMEGEDMKHQPNDEYSYVNNTLRAVNARSRKGNKQHYNEQIKSIDIDVK